MVPRSPCSSEGSALSRLQSGSAGFIPHQLNTDEGSYRSVCYHLVLPRSPVRGPPYHSTG